MITVIGGSGFIGTRLCQRLTKAGLAFENLDKALSEAFPAQTKLVDVRSLEALQQSSKNSSTIINLAAEHRDDVQPKSLYHEVNVQGARNTCELARARGIQKIIFTSTVAVYGFARPGTDETGVVRPFNEYGRTKLEAEKIFQEWQNEKPRSRSLVIVRPTVVFGEGNRGNVYNLLKQIASGRFVMIGNGRNIKSMAYVENVSAFLEYCLKMESGLHLFNYVDKPDFDMNSLVGHIREFLGRHENRVRMPYAVGMGIGKLFDGLALVSGKSFPISSIRVKKFCADTQFNTSLSHTTDFVAPISLKEGLQRTLDYEFDSAS